MTGKNSLPWFLGTLLLLLLALQFTANSWCARQKTTREIEAIMTQYASEIERMKAVAPGLGTGVGEATPSPWRKVVPECAGKGVMTLFYQAEGDKKRIIAEVLGGREDFHGVRIRWSNI